jgi:hypothetical protein
MEINYSLEILKEKKVYNPNGLIINPIVSTGKRIFQINASNGSGKTFLMNLIAFSLRGMELKESKDTIKNSLKEIISRFKDSEYYNLTYDIKYDLPDGNELFAQKKGNEIITFFKQKDKSIPDSNCGANLLHKDLTILYDVPSDPAERLNGVLLNLSSWNDKLKENIDSQLKILNDLDRKSSQTKKIELIKEYSKKIVDYEASHKKLIENRKNDEELLISLKNIEQLKVLYDELRNNEGFEKTNELNFVAFSKQKKPVTTLVRNDKKILELLESKKSIINQFKLFAISLIKIFEIPEIISFITEKGHLSKIQEFSNLDFNSITNLDLTESNEIKLQLIKISDDIIIFLNSKKNLPENQIVEGYRSFLDFLNNINSDIFSEILKARKDDIKKLVQEKLDAFPVEKNYDREINLLRKSGENFGEYLKNLIILHREIKKEEDKSFGNESEGIKYNLALTAYETSKDILRKSNNKISTIKGILLLNGIPETTLINRQNISSYLSALQSKPQLRSLSLNLSSSINELERKIKFSKSEESDTKEKIDLFSLKLEEENKKSEEILNDKHKNRLKSFIKIYSALASLISIFTTLSRQLNAKEKINDLSTVKTLIGQRFLLIAGKIIAQSMENKLIRDDGNFEFFQSVDLIKREYVLDDGRIIKQEDISTGQSSGNYLKQRILNLEGKYIVILLDEIGNMDSSVLKEVISAIKKIENEKRLVLAILSQPGNSTEIFEY